MYYYGARYYNPRESVWLSVDPMVEKTGTPYQYAYQNPIIYTDPDGNEPDCPSCKNEQQWNEYMGLWRNTFELMGSNEWTINYDRAYSNIKVIHDDSGRFTVIVNGEVQDYENRNRLTVFGEFYMPMIDAVVVTGSRAVKSSSSFFSKVGNWVKGLFSSKSKFDPDSFADVITSVNKTTDGKGVLFNGSPESAINSAMYYEAPAEQGASLFRSIAHGHMYENGNKRTAVKAFKEFAKQNKLKTVSDSKMNKVASDVAQGKITDVVEISKQLVK